MRVGQILLTRADVENRQRYLNARDTFDALLEQRIIPVVNENDAVATEEIKVTERFTRPRIGRVDIDVTIDDPKAYTKPWSVKLAWRLVPDTDLIESICEENNKDLPHMVGK